MKQIVRLTENDLTRIVKKVIKEQGQTTQQPSPSNTNKTVEVILPKGTNVGTGYNGTPIITLKDIKLKGVIR